MTDDDSKDFCTIDHANTQKELAQLTPYQFWLDQVKSRREAGNSDEQDDDRPREPVARR